MRELIYDVNKPMSASYQLGHISAPFCISSPKNSTPGSSLTRKFVFKNFPHRFVF